MIIKVAGTKVPSSMPWTMLSAISVVVVVHERNDQRDQGIDQARNAEHTAQAENGREPRDRGRDENLRTDPAVESQAPSSKPSENAPRRSGSPTVVRRLSKLARNEPSNTATTANSGCGAIPPCESGPRPLSLSAISASARAGADAGDDGHARQQAFEQRLILVERIRTGIR